MSIENQKISGRLVVHSKKIRQILGHEAPELELGRIYEGLIRLAGYNLDDPGHPVGTNHYVTGSGCHRHTYSLPPEGGVPQTIIASAKGITINFFLINFPSSVEKMKEYARENFSSDAYFIPLDRSKRIPTSWIPKKDRVHSIFG